MQKSDSIALHVGQKVLDLDVLKAFVAVLQCGSFTRASHLLFRTQSTISMQIRRLEEQVGCVLILRLKSGLKPTTEGAFLMAAAKELLALNDRVFESHDSNLLAGQVRIGAIEFYATSVLPLVISKFCQKHPDVFVEIETGIPGQTQAKLAASYDIVVGVSEVGANRGTVVRCANVVWASSKMHTTHQKSPIPLALYLEGALFGQWATQALDRQRLPWRIAYRSNSIAALKAAVEVGLAVGVFDENSMSSQMRVLGVRDGFPALPKAEIWVSRPSTHASLATVKLHDFLVKTLVEKRSGAVQK